MRINQSIHQKICQVITLTLVGIVLLCSGCSRRYDDMPAFLPFLYEGYPSEGVGRFKTSYLAEQIDTYYKGTNPGPIGITTFVNLDDLYSTSSFGRMLSEQLMSELAMRGFDVIEIRQGDALQFLNTGGEFALSRETSAIRSSRELGAVVVGTYVSSPLRVYLNTRLIDPSTSRVVSAASAEMGKTSEIAKLLRGGGMMPSLERIPVKHLGINTVPASGGVIGRGEAEVPQPLLPVPGKR